MSVQVTVWPRGKKRTKVSGPLGVGWDSVAKDVPAPVFASDIGQLTNVTASTRYEDGFGGHDLASWTITPFGGYVGGMFRPGDHVKITKGGGTVFEGEYSEAEPSADGTVTMHAKGYAYNLYDYDSIHYQDILVGDDVYYPTTLLGVLGDTSEPFDGWGFAAEWLGMPINQVVGDVSAWTDPFGGSPMSPTPLKLGDLITSVHREASERWAVWGRTLVVAADDLDPIWVYDAPEGVVGVADTDYVTHLWLQYVKTGPAEWDSGTAYVEYDIVLYEDQWWEAKVGNTGVTPVEGATWRQNPQSYKPTDYSMVPATDNLGIERFDPRTEVVDYRGLGKIDSVRALNIAESLLSQVKGRFVLSGGFTVFPESGFCSIDGGQADIAFARAGRAVKLTGIRTSQGNLMPDGDVFMIGKTDWSWGVDGAEQLTVTPMGAVPRSLSTVLAGKPPSWETK